MLITAPVYFFPTVECELVNCSSAEKTDTHARVFSALGLGALNFRLDSYLGISSTSLLSLRKPGTLLVYRLAPFCTLLGKNGLGNGRCSRCTDAQTKLLSCSLFVSLSESWCCWRTERHWIAAHHDLPRPGSMHAYHA